MGETRCYLIRREKALESFPNVEAALAWTGDDGYLWFDIVQPEAADFEPLAEPLGLHPLAVEDCLDDEQVPKIEEFPGHSFALFNRWHMGDDGPRIEEINFFLSDRYLISVHGAGMAPDGLGAAFEATARRDLGEACLGPDHLLHVLTDRIVDEKLDVIEILQEQLDDLEEAILRDGAEFQPANLIGLRRNLLRLRKSLVYEREILTKLCRRDSPYISAEAVYAFRDIADHLTKFFEVIEICRELVASTIEIHLATVSNRMAMTDVRTNLVMRRLTMITVVFMPLTLISGIFGMSEWTGLTQSLKPAGSYALFTLLMIGVSYVSYRVLTWYDRRDQVVPAE